MSIVQGHTDLYYYSVFPGFILSDVTAISDNRINVISLRMRITERIAVVYITTGWLLITQFREEHCHLCRFAYSMDNQWGMEGKYEWYVVV